MMKQLLTLMLTLAASLSALAKVQSKTIQYKEGETTLEGVLYFDDKVKGARPGVVVVHEWMGLDDYAKSRARQLAEQGYIAFAADIYGQGVKVSDMKQAAELSGRFKGDRPLLRRRVRAAYETLAGQKNVDKEKMLAIGFCFGGTTVLELARSGAPVAGVVSFHGGLDTPTPADAKNIKAKVLVLHGAIDPYVKPAEVDAFQKEMNDAKVDYQFVAYGGAVHKFSNPEAGDNVASGAAYDKMADQRSQKAMKTFFDEIVLKK